MSTTTRRGHVARGTVLAATAALALGLLPPASATAAVATPDFSYLQLNAARDRVLSSNDAVGTAGAATALTPAGYQVYAYDMAQDGATWVATMRRGSATDDPFDTTYALVLVHSDGTHVSSRVLSTFWDADPVIKADGSQVWWLSNGIVYTFVASYAPMTGAITRAVGTPSVVSTGQLVPARNAARQPLETVTRFAVSPDGRSAAALFASNDRAHFRVRATAMSTGATKPGAFQKSYDTTTSDKTAPSSNTFVFTSGTTLLYDEYDVTSTARPVPNAAVTATVPANAPGSVAVPTTASTALDGVYDVRPYGSSFVMWKDTVDPGTGLLTASSSGSTADLTAAPTSWTDRADGATTFGYVPTSVAPPVLPRQVANPAAAHPSLAFAARSVRTGRQVAFAGLSYYLQDPAGGGYVAGAAAEVDKGVLWWSTDGWRTRSRMATSGARPFLVSGGYYYGRTPRLTRNTSFRWVYPGDMFTSPGMSPRVTVTVVPDVTVRQTLRHGRRTVSGATSRVRGTATLYLVVSGRLRRIATTAITARGAYSFGARVLRRGTYRVITTADASWASGAAAIRF